VPGEEDGVDERSRKLVWLSVYAVALGFLEAAVVVYLRRIYYPENPLALFPLRVLAPADLLVEMGREAATILMILAAAALAERGAARVFAAFAYLFGVWDLAYYFWLKVVLHWPVEWLEWDILLLIPWAWLGPWPAPALVALVLAIWGWRVLREEQDCLFRLGSFLLFAGGALLVLITFLQPAYPLLSGGPEALGSFRPGEFWWPVYGLGLLTMAAGLFRGGAHGGKSSSQHRA
jgi:hypothetical protein